MFFFAQYRFGVLGHLGVGPGSCGCRVPLAPGLVVTILSVVYYQLRSMVLGTVRVSSPVSRLAEWERGWPQSVVRQTTGHGWDRQTDGHTQCGGALAVASPRREWRARPARVQSAETVPELRVRPRSPSRERRETRLDGTEQRRDVATCRIRSMIRSTKRNEIPYVRRPTWAGRLASARSITICVRRGCTYVECACVPHTVVMWLRHPDTVQL